MHSQRKAGALLGYANVAVKNIVNLLYTPMLLSFVGQADYGVFQTANNFIVSLQLLSFGFSGAYIRFYMIRRAEGEEAVRQLNGMYLILYSVISLMAVALGFTFAANCDRFLSGGFDAGQVSLASTIMLILAFNTGMTFLSAVFDAYIVAHERFVFQQSRQMFVSVATPLFAFIALLAGCGVVGVAVAQFAIGSVLLLLNARYAVAKLGMRFSCRRFDPFLFKSVAIFSGWLFINQLFDLFTMNVPSVLLAAISGAAPVAVFAVAATIRSVFYSLSTIVSGMFVPFVNSMVAEAKACGARFTELMIRVGRYQAIVLLWVLGGFVITGRWFVSIWAGSDFNESYWLVIAMVIPAVVPLIQNIGIEMQKAMNMHKARSLAYLVCSIIDLICVLAMAPHFGAWAVVAGYDLYLVLGPGLFMNWYYDKKMGIDVLSFWKNIMPLIFLFVLSTAFCVFGANYLPVTGFATFVIWGVVYTVMFLGIGYRFVFNDDEKRQIADLKKGVRGKDGE